MFRVKASEVGAGSFVAEWVLQAALVLVLAASFVSACLTLEEYRHLRDWEGSPDPPPPGAVAALRQEVGAQVVVSLGVTALLALFAAAAWWLRRRYLSSQRSLRQVKLLARDILASMDRGVVTTDCAGVITSINSAAIGLLGRGAECVGKPLASICPPGVSLVEVYRAVVSNQTAVRDRDFTLDRAGRGLRLRIDAHVLKDTQGTSLGCVLHLRDVTERMLLEDRMRRMERFISLATLASGLHHEIKNPLTALSIHIQLLEEGLSNGQTGGAVDDLVGVLKTEVCRLNGVLESFRSFANLQRLTLQPTDALGVVNNVLRLIRPQAAEQGVAVTLLSPETELPAVPLDAEKFEQALLNLVINALEAMPEGGRLTVQAKVAGGDLQVSVQDSGPGIPTEIRPNLFQPYFSTKDRGSGMGLALSEKLIGQHGGHIGYCTGAEGTTFEISIPLERGNGSA
jgi:PAS domain S-box-containing protein